MSPRRISTFRYGVLGTLTLALAGSSQPVQCAENRPPLSVLLLMDSSGSMKENDRQDVRIAAAESLVAMMADEDEISVVEFGAVAELRLINGKSSWASVKHRSSIYQTLQHLTNNGQFTDFRAALEAAADVFDAVDSKRRKIVLLLTDGILDPNPENESYAPHHISFRLDLFRAGKAGRKQVLDEYRERLSPVARRLIQSQVVPRLQRAGIEVFTVGLSANADSAFLQDLSRQTSRRPEELHTFHAEQATDLIAIFSQLLSYWTDLEILHQEAGPASSETRRTLYLDEYVQQAKLVLLTDSAAEPFLQSSSTAEIGEAGSHRSLHVFPMKRSGVPSSWEFGFRSGTGQFRGVVVGSSGIRIDVRGIQSQYRFGEPVRATARLRTAAALSFPQLPSAEVHAEIRPASGSSSQVVEFRSEQVEHVLTWHPPHPGIYSLTVTAHLHSPTRREVLPRRGLVYQFQVLPSLYVEPTAVNFGTIEKGSSISREVRVHSGLVNSVELTVSSRIKKSSSGAFLRNESARMPQFAVQSLHVPPAATVPFTIQPLVSKSVDWGDYEGEVSFSSPGSSPVTVQFSFHVPSLWEKLRWWVLGLLLLLSALIGYLAWVLGWLRAPFGTLVPVGNCPGLVRGPIRLSQVRRQFFTRWLNWRRNRIRLSEMGLAFRPTGVDVEFVFQTWGTVFISNISGAATFEVTEAGGASFKIKPGRSLRLTSRAVLSIGPCYYRYDAS